MTSIVLKNFSGELPNIPKYKLSDANAQQAINCDFAQNDLRPLKDGALLKTMATTVKGIYTEEGTNFFTWPTETYACKGPVLNDSFGRVYFMNTDGFKVTQYSLATATGGQPSSSWVVGVPTPTTQVTLTVKERSDLPDYPSKSVTLDAWYELDGKQYDKASTLASLVEVTPWKEYTFTPPTRTAYNDGKSAVTTYDSGTGETTTVTATGTPTGTPPDAKLVCQIIFKDTSVTPNKEFFNITISSGSSTPTRSAAFPGGVEMTLTSTGKVTFSWGIVETRAYVYTMVNDFGEESDPSPANTVSVTYMQYVEVGTAVPSFTGYKPRASTNIYRTFGTNANYFKVVATLKSGSTTVYEDKTYKSSDIGVSLPSLDWELPVTGMLGLTAMPNGVFAAYKENKVYLSEPYRPHSWQYIKSFPHPVVGICADAQSLVVTTKANAFMILGSVPANMAVQKLPLPQAGITHKLMTNIEGAVAYASNDGIVLVQGSQATMALSQKFYSREDWRNTISTISADARFGYTDGYLVMVSSASAKGIVIRLDEAAGTLTQLNETYDSMFYLPVQDTLYYSKGANVYRFRGGSYYTLDWWSKDFVLGDYVNFGAAYIKCTASTTITLYADDVQWYQFTASGTGYYRLPSGNRSLRWSVRFQTAGIVEEFAMADAMSELRSV